jgi:hypothetical protein
MIDRMHRVRDGLSRDMPTSALIDKLRAAVQIDSRTKLGRDIQRCLLSCAADRLMLIVEHVDPAPWRTWVQNLRDALAVYRREAVAIYVQGDAYDRGHNDSDTGVWWIIGGVVVFAVLLVVLGRFT